MTRPRGRRARSATASPLCCHVSTPSSRLTAVPAPGQTDLATIRDATVRLPASVVFRALAAETVMLDLRTGLYHHLEPRTGELLEALTQAGGPALAARRFAARTGQAVAAVEAELCALCLALAERGLLDVRPAAAS
jgi:hypothetical protein